MIPISWSKYSRQQPHPVEYPALIAAARIGMIGVSVQILTQFILGHAPRPTNDANELYRSTDLSAWTEIYSFDGSNQMFDANQFSVTLGPNSITLSDKNPPFPKAFYRFEAIFP